MLRGAVDMLKVNQPQTPNGTAVNASAALGLTSGLGQGLMDQTSDELKQRQKDGAWQNPLMYGASETLFGSTK